MKKQNTPLRKELRHAQQSLGGNKGGYTSFKTFEKDEKNYKPPNIPITQMVR